MSAIESASAGKHPYGPPDRWFILTLVSLNYFVLYLHRGVIGYIQPPLMAELGLNDQQMGWLQPAFIVPYALSQLFVAYLSDRFRRRTILIVSLSASVICLAAMGLAATYSQLIVLRMCLGVAQSASVPAIAGIMADSFTSKNRSTAVSVYLFSMGLAVWAAGTYGGKMADIKSWSIPIGAETLTLSGWRLSFLGFSLFGALIVALLTFLLREPERTERQSGSGLGADSTTWMTTMSSVLTTPSFLVLALIFVLFSVVTNSREFWLARYFHDSFDMTLEEAGEFSTLWVQVAQFVGMLMGGIWADRWARSWQGGRGAMSAIGTAAWIPALLIIGTSDSMLHLKIAMMAFGWGLGVYVANLWTTTFDVVDPAARSTATGMLNVFAFAPGFTGPLVGWLKDVGAIDDFGIMFAWFSVLAVANVVLFAVYIWITLPRDFRAAGKE